MLARRDHYLEWLRHMVGTSDIKVITGFGMRADPCS